MKVFPKSVFKKKATPKIQHVLVIRPGGMGDALLLLPVLKEINLNYHLQIDILCEPRNKPVFECCPYVNKILSYQNPFALFTVVKCKSDAVIDTEQAHLLSALVARIIPSPIRLGFSTFNRDKLFTHSTKYKKGSEPDNFYNLFRTIFKLDSSYKPERPYLTSDPSKSDLYDHLAKFACIFSGATTPQRYWSIECWTSVCTWLHQNDFTPVLLGGAMEADHCKKIDLMAENIPVLNLCGKLTIGQTVHLFKKAALLVTTDSGILHLAVICGLSTVSLFGPSDPQKWGPKGQHHIVLSAQTECAPCAQFGDIPKCSDNICMENITPESVIHALENLIQD